MPESPTLTVLGSMSTRPRRPPRYRRFESVDTLEVAAPDTHCAALLLDYVGSTFPAEIAPGSPLIVTFRRPTEDKDWVVEALALVERWLNSVPLPCAKVVYGNRPYLVRAPIRAMEI